MATPKARIIAFDADGCIYSNRYTSILVEIINRYWTLFETIGALDNFSDTDVDQLLQKSNDIIKEIYELETHEEDHRYPFRRITNQLFLNRIEKISKTCLRNGYVISQNQAIILVIREFIGYMNRFNKGLMQAIVLAANRELINYLCNKMEILDIPAFALVIASNRQSFFTDRAGMQQNGTGSIYLDLHEIYFEMHQRLKHKTGLVSEFCSADVFGEKLQRGDSYRGIYNEHLLGDDDEIFFAHAHAVYDSRKLSLIYAIAHDAVIHVLDELAITDKHVPVEIDFFDDRLDILDPLIATFFQYPRLLPSNVTINFYHYDGILRKGQLASVTGTGPLDLNFRKNVMRMAKMCGHDLQTYSNPIDCISQLDIENFLSMRVTGQELTPYKPILPLNVFKQEKHVEQDTKACLEKISPKYVGYNK